MRVFSKDDVAHLLPYPRLIAHLKAAMAKDFCVPERAVMSMKRAHEADALLLTMPAWSDGTAFGGVKIVNVTPGNAARGLAAVTASYLLFDELTGEHVALIDGGELTARRTAAVSALAADILAPKEANTLMLFGSGRIAAESARAFAAVRPLSRVLVLSPTLANAQKLAANLSQDGISAEAITDSARVSEADMVVCATLSEAPLFDGNLLKPNAFVALIGAFTPTMREADDATLLGAEVWVDTLTALKEAGDLSQPIGAGVFAASHIKGDLKGLIALNKSASGLAVFKSVGEATQDLAAASLLVTG